MKFQVPQFIEMEDKIFGPLSFKEFIYLAGGAGLSYILYRYIPSFLIALVFILPVMAFAIALAFFKVNNKPFIEVVQSAALFALGEKLYIWKKEPKAVTQKEGSDLTHPNTSPMMKVPTIGKSKLSNLGFDLDVKGSSSDQTKDVQDSLNIRI